MTARLSRRSLLVIRFDDVDCAGLWPQTRSSSASRPARPRDVV